MRFAPMALVFLLLGTNEAIFAAKFVETPISKAVDLAGKVATESIEVGGTVLKNVDLNVQLESSLEALFQGRLTEKDFTPNPKSSAVQQSVTLLLSALRKTARGCDNKIVCRTKNGYLFANSIFVFATLSEDPKGASGGQKRVKIEFFLNLQNVAVAAYQDTALREWAERNQRTAPKFCESEYVNLNDALLNGPLPHPSRFQASSAPVWQFLPEWPLGSFSTIVVEQSPRVAEVLGSKIQVTPQNGLTYQLEFECEKIRVPEKRLLEEDIQPLGNSETIKYLEGRSSMGNADASELLAGFYLRGEKGLKEDRSQAFKMWVKASEQGSLLGSQMAGTHLRSGDGVRADLKQAYRYSMLAAEDGDCEAKARIAYNTAIYTQKEEFRKEFRKDLQGVSIRCPESPAGSLYWALFLLNESKFGKAIYSTVAAELKNAAVHGSLLGLVLYARIIPELNASSSPDAALLNARVETCIKSAIANGWLLPETADVLRKGSLEAIAKLPVP